MKAIVTTKEIMKNILLAVLLSIVSAGVASAEDAKIIKCAPNEAKFYVAWEGTKKTEGFGFGSTVICGTHDLVNTDAGISLLQRYIIKNTKAKDRPDGIVILNIITLVK